MILSGINDKVEIVKYNLTRKNIELSELDQQEIEEKTQRLKRLIKGPYTFDIVIKRDSHHRQGNVIDCRMTLKTAGNTMHAERLNSTVANVVDEVVEALRKELVKFQEKKNDRR